jgi:MoxR-like ATPase
LNTELIRLQCYEGLTASETIYEWDYMRQLIEIKIRENSKNPEELENYIFSERFLLKRPLLKAILHEGQIPPVLLIDEIDPADEEFEGFLLEFLSEFQVTIPEIGTFKAKQEPIVIITSNRTRELGDGLRRRCLYLYIGYPSYEKELKIIKLKVPNLNERVAEQIVRVVSRIRQMDNILKKPGISETLDFSN